MFERVSCGLESTNHNKTPCGVNWFVSAFDGRQHLPDLRATVPREDEHHRVDIRIAEVITQPTGTAQMINQPEVRGPFHRQRSQPLRAVKAARRLHGSGIKPRLLRIGQRQREQKIPIGRTEVG